MGTSIVNSIATGEQDNHQNSQSWVSLAILVTNAPPPVLSAPTTGRSALSRLAARVPTPVLAPSAFTPSAPVAVTASSVPSVSKPATLPGPPRAAPARPESLLSPTTLPTTSLSVPTP